MVAQMFTFPVAPVAPLAAHAPAVVNCDDPDPKLKVRTSPEELLVLQVPVVSPLMVTVSYSHVFAAEIVNVNGYVRFSAPF